MPRMLPVWLGASLLAAVIVPSTAPARAWAQEDHPECRRCLAEADRSFERLSNGLCAGATTTAEMRRHCLDGIKESRAEAQRQCRQSYVCLVRLPAK